LIRALNLISANLKGWGLRKKVERMAGDIDRGATFSEAIQRAGSPFGGIHVCFIKFGEDTGCLDKVCGSLAAHAEKELVLSRNIVNAMLYPGFILLMALCMGPVLQTIVSQKPMTEAIFPAIRNLLVFGGVSGGLYLLFGFATRGGIDRVLVNIPFIGLIFQNLALARFTRALSVGLFAGVPLLQALTTAIQVSGNPWLQSQLQHLPKHVGGGKNLASGLEAAGFLPGTLREMIMVGEQSGKLPEMLEKTATFFEEEASNRVGIIMKLLPAVIFLIVAIYVGSMIVNTWQQIFAGRGMSDLF
jgi:type IV pilus assembly protein PilC